MNPLGPPTNVGKDVGEPSYLDAWSFSCKERNQCPCTLSICFKRNTVHVLLLF